MKLFHQSTGSVLSPLQTIRARRRAYGSLPQQLAPRFYVSKNPINRRYSNSRHIDTWLAGRAKPSLKAIRDSLPPSGFLFHSVDLIGRSPTST